MVKFRSALSQKDVDVFKKVHLKMFFFIVFALIYTCQSRSHNNLLFEVKFWYHNLLTLLTDIYFQRINMVTLFVVSSN